MAKTASLKTIALRALKDPKTGAATRLVALRAAKPYLDATDYEHRLRQLAETARGRLLRLLLVELTEIDSASRADEAAKQKRAEVDRILADAARELDLPDPPATAKPAIVGVPRVMSSVVTERALEPQPTLSDVPVHGPSSAPAPTASELEEQRAQVLKRGRELAVVILTQLERNYFAPYNFEEGRKLDNLRAAFVAWEKQASIQFPDINTQEEFPDARLRPVPTRIVDERTYRVQRRTMTVDEQLAIPLLLAQAQPRHEDSGMWGGIPGGI